MFREKCIVRRRCAGRRRSSPLASWGAEPTCTSVPLTFWGRNPVRGPLLRLTPPSVFLSAASFATRQLVRAVGPATRGDVMQKQVLARLGLVALGSLAMSCAPADSGQSLPDGTGERRSAPALAVRAQLEVAVRARWKWRRGPAGSGGAARRKRRCWPRRVAAVPARRKGGAGATEVGSGTTGSGGAGATGNGGAGTAGSGGPGATGNGGAGTAGSGGASGGMGGTGGGSGDYWGGLKNPPRKSAG